MPDPNAEENDKNSEQSKKSRNQDKDVSRSDPRRHARADQGATRFNPTKQAGNPESKLSKPGAGKAGHPDNDVSRLGKEAHHAKSVGARSAGGASSVAKGGMASAGALKAIAAGAAVVAVAAIAGVAVGIIPNPLAARSSAPTQAPAQDVVSTAASQDSTSVPAQQAATTIAGGTLEESQTWQGEVTVTGDVVIPSGVTLTIQPGTVVEFTPFADDNPVEPAVESSWDSGNAAGIFTRGGVLIAKGTAENPIVLLPAGTDRAAAEAMAHLGDEDLTGSWDGLEVTSDSQLSFVHLYYPARGIRVINPEYKSGAAVMEIGNVQVTNAVFSAINVSNADSEIHHAVIRGSARGIQLEGEGNANIHHNKFDKVGRAVAAASQTIVVLQNNIFTNVHVGLESHSDQSVTVAQNTFFADEEQPAVWNFDDVPVEATNGDSQAVDISGTGTFQIFNNITVGPFRHFCTFNTNFRGPSSVGYNLGFGILDEPFGGRSGGFGSTPQPDGTDPLLVADPQFTDSFTLSPDSPAVDAGAPDTLDADGSPADLGAYGGPNGDNW